MFLRALRSLGVISGLALASGAQRPATIAPNAASVLPLAPTGCALRTPREWQNFVAHAAENPKWVETCEDRACDADYYRMVHEKVFGTLAACASFIAAHPAIEKCTRNLRRFTPTWLQQHDSSSYGFTVSNQVYLADQEKPDKPTGMMSPPAAIVAALPIQARVERAARENGWLYLTHDSALGGFRTFVVVVDPSGRFDQWFLLNLQKGETSIESGTPLSLIAVQKKDARGRRLPKTVLHFRDFTIQHTKRAYRLEVNTEANGKCYSCHPGGMRQLIARRTPILASKPSRGEAGYDASETGSVPADFAYTRLHEFNRRIRSYGNPDWKGRIVPRDHGPALGAEFGCLECHNGRTRAALNLSTSHAQMAQKVVAELGMPPDSPWPRALERSEMRNPALSDSEKKNLAAAVKSQHALLAAFEASRFPALKRWLLETPCQ